MHPDRGVPILRLMGDDWRLTGQEGYLQGATFVHKPYRAWSATWDHDHCTFCTRKFVGELGQLSDDGVLAAGYSALGRGPQGEDDYHWVCDVCFADFRERFDWKIKAAGD
jgi:hypothetical protein